MRLLAAVLLLAALFVAPSSPVSAAPPRRALYLVQVDGAPIASYEGGVAGIPSTKPREGTKIDKNAWNYNAYRQVLRSRRAEVLRAAGVTSTVAEYSTAFNGFAAALTPSQVA